MVDTHIYSRWVHVFSMGYPVIVAYKTSNWPTGARLELFEALCLQTWLAGKSPTGFVDFPMKNTFFKPPCIAGAISPARKDSVAQRGESSGCSVLSPK